MGREMREPLLCADLARRSSNDVHPFLQLRRENRGRNDLAPRPPGELTLGELAWELYVPTDQGPQMWFRGALVTAGAKYGLKLSAGCHARTVPDRKGLSPLRPRHYRRSHVLEAGPWLFAVKTDKGAFIGREAFCVNVTTAPYAPDASSA